jgi:Putative Ig domain
VTTRVLIGSFVVAVSLVLSAAAASARAASLPRVTVISDSIISAVDWNATPTAILEQGIDLQMQVGICRRVEGVSCPFDGGEVPTLVDLVPDLGSSIAQTVIVEVGYNDPADVFPQEVDDAMQVLFRAGVTRVLWVNMREAQGQYPVMNADLLAAAGRYPQLTVIDWNAYSVDHPEWFQTDGMHLLEAGGEGMATLLHNALMQLVLTPPLPLYPAPAPPVPPLVLPAAIFRTARVGRPYATLLVATGGTAPYRWRVTSGPLPRGLHLLADGTLTGTPRRLGRFKLTFRATDALGQAATQQARLVIVAA